MALKSVAQDTCAMASLQILVNKQKAGKLTIVTDRAKCVGNATISSVLTVAYSALATLATTLQMLTFNQVNFFKRHAQNARNLSLGYMAGALLLAVGIISPSAAVKSVRNAINANDDEARNIAREYKNKGFTKIETAVQSKIEARKSQEDLKVKGLVTEADIIEEGAYERRTLGEQIDGALSNFYRIENKHVYTAVRDFEKACSEEVAETKANLEAFPLQQKENTIVLNKLARARDAKIGKVVGAMAGAAAAVAAGGIIEAAAVTAEASIGAISGALLWTKVGTLGVGVGGLTLGAFAGEKAARKGKIGAGSAVIGGVKAGVIEGAKFMLITKIVTAIGAALEGNGWKEREMYATLLAATLII